MSIVSVSRRAGPPQFGQATFTQSVAAPSGDCALRLEVEALGGRAARTGSWSLGHRAPRRTSAQWMIGIGVPQ